MADSPNSTILSRRNALSAAAAVMALVPFANTPAGAAPLAQAHDEWLALFEAFVAADKAHSDAFNELDEAKLSAGRLHPKPRFKFSYVGFGWGRGKSPGWHWLDGISGVAAISMRGHNWNRATIENYYDEHLSHGLSHKKEPDDQASFRIEGERRKAESLADFDKWATECRAIDQDHGLPELKAIDEEALVAMNAAEDLIRAKPIDSFAAIAVNLALWARYSDGESWEEPLVDLFRATSQLAGMPELFDGHIPYWFKPGTSADEQRVQS
jgi:hypothetical protein